MRPPAGIKFDARNHLIYIASLVVVSGDRRLMQQFANFRGVPFGTLIELTEEGMEQVVVLDHGYVRLIETWGSEEGIIEAARMSTAKGFLGWHDTQTCLNCGLRVTLPCDDPHEPCSPPLARSLVRHVWGAIVPGDEKLIKFLYENKHMTPFEMAGAIIEVKAPIFVFREWHRHRTQSYNEMSARYIPLPDENYIPDLHDVVARSRVAFNSSNRQASLGGGEAIDQDHAAECLAALQDYYERGQKLYDRLLRAGFPKELARLPVTVARYSRMRASANLRNWLQFLTLRQAPNAQKEIRLYADALHQLLNQKFPRTMALFRKERA